MGAPGGCQLYILVFLGRFIRGKHNNTKTPARTLASPPRLVYGGETGATARSEAGADGAAGPPQGGSGRLRIALNGKSRGAHQLTARGGAGWEDKTQLLFVTSEAGFGREQLVEKLRALELVLGFELAVDVVDGGMHMPGDA